MSSTLLEIQSTLFQPRANRQEDEKLIWKGNYCLFNGYVGTFSVNVCCKLNTYIAAREQYNIAYVLITCPGLKDHHSINNLIKLCIHQRKLWFYCLDISQDLSAMRCMKLSYELVIVSVLHKVYDLHTSQWPGLWPFVMSFEYDDLLHLMLFTFH